ncbi:hypothetical protein TNCT_470511 [Trichonephila clavata]|uniref:Uncharacterized protein n=1 Tax=Trichonephila clavata TaxID=2740835 RepID=A0A8X6HTU7_TRICU|nr:hypothetical protein TNCT_470511 [Trichonephila clavata]
MNHVRAVFIIFTTGDGKPSDSAEKFYRRINRGPLSPNYLEKLNYVLLDSVVKEKKLPPHIQSYLSLKDLFTHCIEIRSIPKRSELERFYSSKVLAYLHVSLF